MATEAQRRASKKYYESHKDYYTVKANEGLKRIRKERREYKARCEKALNDIQYVIDFGFDYDGFNNADDLKGLIDTMVEYAKKARSTLRGDKCE